MYIVSICLWSKTNVFVKNCHYSQFIYSVRQNPTVTNTGMLNSLFGVPLQATTSGKMDGKVFRWKSVVSCVISIIITVKCLQGDSDC